MKNKFNLFLFIFSSLYVKRYRKKKYKIMNDNDTIDKIIDEGCSLARYGDGEFKWMMGVKQNSFQKQSNDLAIDLLEVIKYDNPKLIIGIPHAINNVKGYNFVGKYYWNYFMCKYFNTVSKFLNKDNYYADASISRPYIDYKYKYRRNENFSLFKKVWNNRNILILEGDSSYFGVGSDLFDNVKSIRRIICPSHDAYFVIDKIYDSCLKNSHKDDLILMALGPTATVMAYRLCSRGYQAIDIGHLDIEYLWYLNKAFYKKTIKGKHVNEGIKGFTIDIDMDKYMDKYNNEIIDRICLDEKDN